MANLRSKFVMSLATVKKVLSIFGCLLFLCSVIFPFLYQDLGSFIPEDWDQTSYWSFKSSTQQVRSLRLFQTVEYWFGDYWAKEYDYRSELLTVFVIMLVAQILTLITGVASVLLNGKILAPAVLCLMVIASMV
jgi:hypothetical protein